VRLEYRQACRQANEAIVEARQKFNQDQLNAARDNPRTKWSIIRNILHHNALSDSKPFKECQDLTNKLSLFFRDKVRLVKQRISVSFANLNLDPLFADSAHSGIHYTDLPPPALSEVLKLVNSMSAKSSAADRFPASLLKSCSDVFVPLITRLAHLSFTEGVFPTVYKTASVTPLLKKKGLNSDDPANFRPISNLNTISKILERLFLSRFMHTLKTAVLSASFSPPIVVVIRLRQPFYGS